MAGYLDASGLKHFKRKNDATYLGKQEKAASAKVADSVVWENVSGRPDLSALIPPGTIINYAGSTVPEGYLLCNGANVSRTTYANLFAAIGTAWGSGDGSTTFTLPNFSGRFLEGTTSAGSVGDYLSAGLPNITGSFTPWGFRSSLNPSGAFTQAGTSESSYDTRDNGRGSYISFSASRSNSIYGRSTTVQPSSGSVYFCIKI